MPKGSTSNDISIQALTQLKMIEKDVIDLSAIKMILKAVAAPEKKVSDVRVQFRQYELNKTKKRKS